jgi:hypothetical protein
MERSLAGGRVAAATQALREKRKLKECLGFIGCDLLRRNAGLPGSKEFFVLY